MRSSEDAALPAWASAIDPAGLAPRPRTGIEVDTLQIIYSTYAVVLPVVLCSGLAYLFIAGEMGLVAALSSAFVLAALTATAIVLRDANVADDDAVIR